MLGITWIEIVFLLGCFIAVVFGILLCISALMAFGEKMHRRK